MHPFEGLLSTSLVTPSHDMDLNELTADQTDTFIRASKLISTAYRKNNLLITYRGDGYANLASALNVPTDEQGLVYQRAFYFGNKAKHYLERQDKISRRPHLTSIEDVNDSTFIFIFDKIAEISRNADVDRERFWSQNIGLCKFFSQPSNKDYFVTKVKNESQVVKAKVRDYYLFLLHTAGKRGVTKESLLVSTSISWEAAAKFNNKNDARKVIYFYFIPTPFDKYCVTANVESELYPVVRSLGLPSYTRGSGLFYWQREVAVRGGLLPHFMLGIHRVDLDQFVVNPHLLKMPREKLPFIIERGIEINQNDFDERIKETSYQRFSSLEGEQFYGFEIDG